MKTGLSEVIGSWKIIEMSLPRIFAISSSSSVREVLPVEDDRSSSASTRPGASISLMIESAVTDLPLPDSPTTPSVPPFGDREVDAVDGADQAAVGVEPGAEVLDA